MAVLILGKIGDPGSVKIIMECSGSPDTKLAKCSIYALGEIGGSEASIRLKDILENSRDSIKKRASALSLIKIKKYDESVILYICSNDDFVAARLGLMSGTTELQEAIRKWLRKKNIDEPSLLAPIMYKFYF